MYPSPTHSPHATGTVAAMAAAFSASQGAAATRGAGATASPAATPTAQDPETWTRLANLTQIIDTLRENVGQVTLTKTDLSRLNTVLQQADPVCLPPDRHAAMNQWRTELQHALTVSEQGARPSLAVRGEQLSSLVDLLRDVQITHSQPASGTRPEENQWEALPPTEQSCMRRLGEWMSEGSGAQKTSRSELGRMLARQYVRLQTEFHLGTDGAPLDLPDGRLLHELIDYKARGSLTLSGPVNGQAAKYSLCALPLRTWHVSDTDNLRWLIQGTPIFDIETLDLRHWDGDLDLEATSLLSQAHDRLSNLCTLVTPSRVEPHILGDAWTAAPGEGCWTYTLKNRPNVLAVLDATVESLNGYVLGTRGSIRRMANKTDAICLLEFAQRVSPHLDFRVSSSLLDMFVGASKSDEDLRGYAEALRKAQQQGLGPVETLDTVQEQMAARVSTAVKLGAEPPRQVSAPGAAADKPASHGPREPRETATLNRPHLASPSTPGTLSRAGIPAPADHRAAQPVAGPFSGTVSRLAADIASKAEGRPGLASPRGVSSPTGSTASAAPFAGTVQRRFAGAPVLTLELPSRPTLTALNLSKLAPVQSSSPAPTVVHAKVAPPPPPRVRNIPTSLALATARATSQFFATSGLAAEQRFSPISLDSADNDSVGPHGSGFETDVSGLDSPDGWSLPPFPEEAEPLLETPTWPSPPPPLTDDSVMSPSDSEMGSSTLASSVSVQSMVWTPAAKATRPGTLNLSPSVASRAPTVLTLRSERDAELAGLRTRTPVQSAERAAFQAKLNQTLKR